MSKKYLVSVALKGKYWPRKITASTIDFGNQRITVTTHLGEQVFSSDFSNTTVNVGGTNLMFFSNNKSVWVMAYQSVLKTVLKNAFMAGAIAVGVIVATYVLGVYRGDLPVRTVSIVLLFATIAFLTVGFKKISQNDKFSATYKSLMIGDNSSQDNFKAVLEELDKSGIKQMDHQERPDTQKFYKNFRKHSLSADLVVYYFGIVLGTILGAIFIFGSYSLVSPLLALFATIPTTYLLVRYVLRLTRQRIIELSKQETENIIKIVNNFERNLTSSLSVRKTSAAQSRHTDKELHDKFSELFVNNFSVQTIIAIFLMGIPLGVYLLLNYMLG